MRARSSCLHYQQFDYSTSDPERERSENLLSHAPDHSQVEPPSLLETLMHPDEQPLSPEPANDVTTTYHFSHNMGLFQNNLKRKMFPRQRQKLKHH